MVMYLAGRALEYKSPRTTRQGRSQQSAARKSSDKKHALQAKTKRAGKAPGDASDVIPAVSATKVSAVVADCIMIGFVSRERVQH